MPRFFINLTDSKQFLADNEGLEFSDIDAARRHALQEARFLVGQDEGSHRVTDWHGWRLEITDEADRVVLTIPLPAADAPQAEAA